MLIINLKNNIYALIIRDENEVIILTFKPITGETKIKFSYEVRWELSDIRWASRWDTYLAMSDVQIHWFSIINSVVVVFFLAGILTMIIVRTLRRDIAKYNKMDDEVRKCEKSI